MAGVHVASSLRSHGREAKDGGIGCSAVEVGPNYPSVVVFISTHRGILVFCFCI
jgi:hypothetical protein